MQLVLLAANTPTSVTFVGRNMVIKTYLCPNLDSEDDVQKIKEALANAPVNGVDVLLHEKAVRVGLNDEEDDDLIKCCLSDCGYAPKEVLADTHEDLAKGE